MYKLTLIASLFFITNTHAQKNNELNLYFDQPEALKKAGVNQVHSIFKDSRKLVWIGTENGLYRYDGTNVVYQRHKAGDTTSIPNNVIKSITEDQQHNIWIGTLGGVARINPYSLKCTVYTDELNRLPQGNFDNKVFVDVSGQVWTANGDGLYVFEKNKNAFRKCWANIISGNKLSGYLTSIDQWSADTLVLGSFIDIILVNTKNYGFRRIRPLSEDVLVNAIHIDQQHRLWIGTWSEGCFISNQTLTKFQQYKWEKDQRSALDNIAVSFAETSSSAHHDMWIAAGWTLLKIPLRNESEQIDLSSAMIYRVGHGQNNNDPTNIGVLLFDEGSFLWAGGTSTVSQFSAENSLFDDSRLTLDGAAQNVQSITIGKRNYIAVSTWHGVTGIHFWERSTGAVTTMKSIAPSDQYGSNISGVAVDKYGRLWMASLAGLYILDDEFRIKKDFLKNPAEDVPSSKKINDILIHNDTVWVACYKGGIDLYDLNFRKIKHFADGDGSGLRDMLNERFFTDRKGNIWVCGNSYFYKYLPARTGFKKFDFSVEHTAYLANDVTELPDGHLVIATETAGLIYLDPSSEKFERILNPLLEKEESINSVTADEQGNIWYLTLGHLVKYEPALKKFTLFGEEDGLNSGLQLVRCFNGKEIFLAESKKLLKFSPFTWKKVTEPPRLLIHSVQVNDSAIVSSSPLHEMYLNYDQNKIYFEFDGITYTKPEQNQYAYQLTSIDKDWIYSNKNSVAYANLSPGHYEFHVKAANYAGEWSKEYVIAVSIAPPYWRTWWFISLIVLATGGILVAVVRYIAQRNLRERILRLEKEQAVEKERNRIARDMHDDLGSGLTKIAILSEVAKTQLQQKEAANLQLENISHSSRELVDNLQNIIWVLNPKNDSLENLAAYIREYALKFFDATDVIIQFNYPQNIPSIRLSEEQRRNIFMVVKETLNNIAKHSDCNKVIVDLHVKSGKILIEIRDDGKGFEESHVRQFANGLINMKQRMEQINGHYSISSSNGNGTTTKLVVHL